jgi:molybdopterin synthase sulfur carrier subunit
VPSFDAAWIRRGPQDPLLALLDGSVLAARSPARYTAAMHEVTARVLFFGRLKDIVGVSEAVCRVPEGAPIAQVFSLYVERCPELAAYRKSVVASRNREFASFETPIGAGDEIAFLPPVSGG